MATYAIGDIHGCYDQLVALLAKIQPGPDDKLIFLGDYIDRGPEPRRVIEMLLELPAIFLRGNHEDMLLNYLENGSYRDVWLANGGRTTLNGYGGSLRNLNIPPAHLEFIRNTKLYHEDDNYIYVHAGLQPDLPLSEQPSKALLWSRYDFITAPTGRNKKVIFGHTPFSLPYLDEDKIGIDTGAVFGGRLSAIRLPDETIITQDDL